MPRPLHTLARLAALLAALPVLSARALAGAVRPGGAEERGGEADGAVYVVVPYPPGGKSGGARAIGGLLRALEGGFAVETIPLYELRPAGGRVRRMLADWLTHALPMPVHCRPFALDGGTIRRRIRDGRPVVIEFLSGSLFLLFGARPANRLVLREHEPLCRRLWSERRTAKGAERMLRPLQGLLAWLAMAAVYARVDRIVALTEQDAAYLRRAFPFAAGKVAAVPVSLDLPRPVPTERGPGREVLMLGNFHHRPNVDGLRWWLAEVAPRLDPGWTLHLCGLDAPLDGADLPPSSVRVVRHGYVEDVAAAFAAVPIAVAPVISGGGVRMKNLELAALGKAIVTTSLGNEGIGLVDGREAVVVDDPGAMAAALRRLDAHPAAAERMGARAADRVRAGFGHGAVLARFRELLGMPAGEAEDEAGARVASHAASSAGETAGVRGGRESVVYG